MRRVTVAKFDRRLESTARIEGFSNTKSSHDTERKERIVLHNDVSRSSCVHLLMFDVIIGRKPNVSQYSASVQYTTTLPNYPSSTISRLICDSAHSAYIKLAL